MKVMLVTLVVILAVQMLEIRGDPRILAMGVLENRARSAPKIFATPTFGASNKRASSRG